MILTKVLAIWVYLMDNFCQEIDGKCFFIVDVFLAGACADPTPYYATIEFSLVPPVNGRFDEGVYVLWHCNNATHLFIGSKFSVCKQDGTWSPAVPTCYGNKIIISLDCFGCNISCSMHCPWQNLKTHFLPWFNNFVKLSKSVNELDKFNSIIFL